MDAAIPEQPAGGGDVAGGRRLGRWCRRAGCAASPARRSAAPRGRRDSPRRSAAGNRSVGHGAGRARSTTPTVPETSRATGFSQNTGYPRVQGLVDQGGVRAGRGGDHHTVQAVRVHLLDPVAAAYATACPPTRGAGGVQVRDDEPVDLVESEQCLGVEPADPTGAEQPEFHSDLPIVGQFGPFPISVNCATRFRPVSRGCWDDASARTRPGGNGVPAPPAHYWAGGRSGGRLQIAGFPGSAWVAERERDQTFRSDGGHRGSRLPAQRRRAQFDHAAHQHRRRAAERPAQPVVRRLPRRACIGVARKRRADVPGRRSTRSRQGDSLTEGFLEFRVDGLVIVGTLQPSRELEKASATVPTVVAASRDIALPNVDVVANDDAAGARLAVEHLLDLGHRRIAHISGSTGEVARLRLETYVAVMNEADLEPLIERTDMTEEAGYRAGVRLLARAEPPTAVFAVNDISAIGALWPRTNSKWLCPGSFHWLDTTTHTSRASGTCRSLPSTTLATRSAVAPHAHCSAESRHRIAKPPSS